MIVDRINAYLAGTGKPIDRAILHEVGNLAEYAFERQFGERGERKGGIRLSSIGRCIRQQAYNLLDFPTNGKEIDARAKTVFFMGDIVEDAVVALAKIAGCTIIQTGLDQGTVQIDGIDGHPDGIIVEGETKHLLEVKSMSSYGFKEFERGVIDEGYRYQFNAYMEASGLEKVCVVALNKDAGVLAEQICTKDPVIVADIHKRISDLKAATTDNLPARPFTPNDKGFYPWNCLYCSFHGTCLPGAEKVLVGKAYKLKAKKEKTA